MIVVMVDKMLKTQIVDCPSVVKWIFSDAMHGEFTNFFVWEIMHSTVNRMGKQVEKVRGEYAQLHERFKKSSLDPESVQSEISEEELEHKLASLNTLRGQQKDLFFSIIDRFIDKLTRHLNAQPTSNNNALPNVKLEEGVEIKPVDDGPYYYKWSVERFEDLILTVSYSLSLSLFLLDCEFKLIRMIKCLIKHHEDVLPYLDEIKAQFFTANVHKSLMKVFRMFSTFKK